MASRVIRPVERQAVIDISSLAASATVGVTLARRIDVTPFTTVTAFVRCHAGTQLTTLSVSDFVINADGFTHEDPAAVTGGGNVPAFQQPLVTTSLISGFAVGQMKVISVPTPSSLLSLSMNITQGAGAGTVRYVISVDLICKEF